jgi:hypothetical protein
MLENGVYVVEIPAAESVARVRGRESALFDRGA